MQIHLFKTRQIVQGILTINSILILFFVTSCSEEFVYKDAEQLNYQSNNYTTILLGNGQSWMTQNLDTDKFRNGEVIKEVKSYEERVQAHENKEPAWSYYENDPQNGMLHGKLYNWYAVIDEQCLCPEGWEVPSKTDWLELTEFLGGDSIAGYKLKSIDHWLGDDGSKSMNGSNESGFNALPSGFRAYFDYFRGINEFVNYWSSNTPSFDKDQIQLNNFRKEVNFFMASEDDMNPVRCIKLKR